MGYLTNKIWGGEKFAIFRMWGGDIHMESSVGGGQIKQEDDKVI